MSFAFFDHTGDIGVRLEGRTLDDLFASAAAAFTDTVTDPARIEPRRRASINLEAPALDLLLVDWLSELLYRFETEQLLVAATEVHISGCDLGRSRSNTAAAIALQAVVTGETFDPERHGVKALVKAITYHALEVREDADGWHATVVFDI